MLGAVVGDIIGSTYEFVDMKDYDFELLPQGSCFTDDTVMTIAVAYWLAHYDEEGLTNEDVGAAIFLLTLKCVAAKQEAAQDSMREADKRPFNPKMY